MIYRIESIVSKISNTILSGTQGLEEDMKEIDRQRKVQRSIKIDKILEEFKEERINLYPNGIRTENCYETAVFLCLHKPNVTKSTLSIWSAMKKIEKHFNHCNEHKCQSGRPTREYIVITDYWYPGLLIKHSKILNLFKNKRYKLKIYLVPNNSNGNEPFLELPKV